jgi:predicted Zn-dependent protease
MSDSERAYELYESGREALAADRLEDAIRTLEESAELDPHFKTLELLGEAWLRKGVPQSSVVPLAAATTLNDQARAPSLLAEAFAALGQDLEAHRIAKVALTRDSRNRRAKAVFDATLEAYRKWSGE